MDEPLPVGLGLRVRVPAQHAANAVGPFYYSPPQVPPGPQKSPVVGPDGLCEFDDLDIWQVRHFMVFLFLLADVDCSSHVDENSHSRFD